jgi:hypothetical protein
MTNPEFEPISSFAVRIDILPLDSREERACKIAQIAAISALMAPPPEPAACPADACAAPPPLADVQVIEGTLEYAHHDPACGLAGCLDLFVRVEGGGEFKDPRCRVRLPLTPEQAGKPPATQLGRPIRVTIRRDPNPGALAVVSFEQGPTVRSIADDLEAAIAGWRGLDLKDERTKICMRVSSLAHDLRRLGQKPGDHLVIPSAG